jgi:hypothetical protein
MGRICTLRMYLVVNVFLDLFHHAYFFVGTRKAGSRAPAPAHAFHSCSSWSGGYLSLSIGSPSFPTRTGPAETRNQTAPKEKKENISISDCFSLSLSQNRRQIILRAGTNRFAGSEPETQRSPSLSHLRRRRNKEEAGAEDCRRSGGARGASEREKLLQAAGGGRGRGGGRDLGGITRAGTAAAEGGF